jgi:vacuolar-type H+-ATPase subunit I/STV1
MSEIKQQLKNIIEQKMIPECVAYLKDLNELLAGNEAIEDDIEAVKEMESFLEELQNISKAIDDNEINDEDANIIYAKIIDLIESSEHEVE